jgi:hypothetical protein
MNPTYHIWSEEEAKGPFTLGQLRTMWNNGLLTAQHLFSQDECQNWQYLAELIPDLEPVAQIPVTKIESEENDGYKLAIKYYISKGWTVVSEGATGVQLQEPKTMGGVTITCLILGLILLAAYGAGLILIICALIGHGFKKPKTEFIARDTPSELIKKQLVNREKQIIENHNSCVYAFLLVFLLAIGAAALYFYIQHELK